MKYFNKQFVKETVELNWNLFTEPQKVEFFNDLENIETKLSKLSSGERQAFYRAYDIEKNRGVASKIQSPAIYELLQMSCEFEKKVKKLISDADDI